MNRELAEHFTKNWLDAWNAHDLPRILSHYTDDFEMSSPVIIQVTGNPEGRLQGKQAVGDCYIDNHRIGVNSVVIHYVGATGKRVAEVFHFNEAGLVFRAQAHYEP